MLSDTLRSLCATSIRGMGTAAMLRAAGVGVGDEVIVPAFGNVEVAEAATQVGVSAVFADIDPVTYCLDAGGPEHCSSTHAGDGCCAT